ncbi:MAG TPA: endonuclease/exonuclease/phosphatase family protein [Prolixibacteraceae bacterium]|nr:endonuclease/exonuclease/phosphatase family protein [Prolixibacteraceae bacterium]
MKTKLGLLVILIGIASSCTTEKRTLRNEYTVVSYNVENLFDTVDDPTIPDEEFLPESDKEWTAERYQKKLNDLAEVISEVNPKELPEIVGLVEVENQTVLEDLIHTAKLNNQYAIIHEESPDYRGIDVALIYRKDAFTEVMHEVLAVTFPEDPDFKTRDILYVTGKIRNKTVHLFVNHWPSRIGGDEKTEPKRVLAASVLKNKVDQVLSLDPNARIIIMGDMNDEPANKSLEQILGAQSPDSGATLVNLMMPDDLLQLGTYSYKGNWNMLDNLVVSGNLISGKRMQVEGHKGFVFSQDWMIYTSSKGDQSPNRTYVGKKYVAGVSDHFPVYFKMKVK